MGNPIKDPSVFEGWKFCDYFVVVSYRAFAICIGLAILVSLPIDGAREFVAGLFGHMGLACPSAARLVVIGFVLLLSGIAACVKEGMN